MKLDICLAASSLLLPSVAAAQTLGSSDCKGAQFYGNAEVSVVIQAGSFKSPASARPVPDYDVSLGPNDSLRTLCLHGDGAVVFLLADSSRYAFRDIRFEYPFGFEPVASPFKLTSVLPGSVVLHMASSPASDGLLFKYTLTVKDQQTGAVLSIDPMIGNDRNPP